MKEQYESVEIEVIWLDRQDAIITSDGWSGDTNKTVNSEM